MAKRKQTILEKYNLGGKTAEDFANVTIKMTTEVFGKTPSGRSWRTKPTECESRTINGMEYLNFIESIVFFNDRVTMGYTCKGYIPTKLVAVNPYHPTGQKVVRRFQFIY